MTDLRICVASERPLGCPREVGDSAGVDRQRAPVQCRSWTAGALPETRPLAAVGRTIWTGSNAGTQLSLRTLAADGPNLALDICARW